PIAQPILRDQSKLAITRLTFKIASLFDDVDLRGPMKESLFTWLESFGFTITPVIAAVLILGIILITALAIHILLHQGILRVMEIYAKQSQRWWHAAFFRHRLFTRLALTLQAVILLTQARIWLEAD